MQGEHELPVQVVNFGEENISPEVNRPAVVRVKRPEDVLAEVVSISAESVQYISIKLFSYLGNILEYMATNFSLLSSPLGQSLRKPSYHSCGHLAHPTSPRLTSMVVLSRLVFCWRNSMSSLEILLCDLPMVAVV